MLNLNVGVRLERPLKKDCNVVRLEWLAQGQTSASMTKHEPSFQVLKWPCTCHAFSLFWSKTALLNLQTLPKQLLGYLPFDIALPG
jgi:hypothetical protein